MEFREWLKAYHKGKDTPIGDLYGDATKTIRQRFQTQDDYGWNGNTSESLREFMAKNSANYDACMVFENAVKEYEKYLADNPE
jgi:hypothetical protein